MRWKSATERTCWSEASLGTAKHLKTDFYSPLEPSQTFYGEASFAYDKTLRSLFNPDPEDQSFNYLDTEYSFFSTDLALGWNLQPWSRLSLGVDGKMGSIDVRNLNGVNSDAISWGPYVRFEHDTLDSRYFPYEGVFWDIKGGYSHVRLDYHNDNEENERNEGVNYHLSMIKPWSWDRHSLNLILEGGGSTSQEEVPLLVQDLGGLFRLSGFQHYQLSGRYSLFGGLRYIYRVVDNDFGALRAPLYLGGSLEQGGVWDKGEDISIESSFTGGSVYVGIESFLGPIFLGYGMAEGGNNMFYLQLGTTFE